MNRDIILKARIFEQISRDRGMEIFEQLSPHCLDLKKREILFRDGEKVEQFAIVEYGELSATKLYQDGRQSLLLKFLPSYMVGGRHCGDEKADLHLLCHSTAGLQGLSDRL